MTPPAAGCRTRSACRTRSSFGELRHVPPVGRWGCRRSRRCLRLRGGGGAVGLALLLRLLAVEPVGLQRVVQRRPAVTGTRGRRQRLGLLAGGTLRGGRPLGAEVGAVAVPVDLRPLELPGVRGVLTVRQIVLTGGAVVKAGCRELARGAGVVRLRDGELSRVGRVRRVVGLARRAARRGAEDVRADELAAVLRGVGTGMRGVELGPRERAGVLRSARTRPRELPAALRSVRPGTRELPCVLRSVAALAGNEPVFWDPLAPGRGNWPVFCCPLVPGRGNWPLSCASRRGIAGISVVAAGPWRSSTRGIREVCSASRSS